VPQKNGAGEQFYLILQEETVELHIWEELRTTLFVNQFYSSVTTKILATRKTDYPRPLTNVEISVDLRLQGNFHKEGCD